MTQHVNKKQLTETTGSFRTMNDGNCSWHQKVELELEFGLEERTKIQRNVQTSVTSGGKLRDSLGSSALRACITPGSHVLENFREQGRAGFVEDAL